MPTREAEAVDIARRLKRAIMAAKAGQRHEPSVQEFVRQQVLKKRGLPIMMPKPGTPEAASLVTSKLGAWEAGVTEGMEKMALSTKTMSEAAGKRISQAARAGGAGNLISQLIGVPTPGNIRGIIAASKLQFSPKGQLYIRRLGEKFHKAHEQGRLKGEGLTALLGMMKGRIKG